MSIQTINTRSLLVRTVLLVIAIVTVIAVFFVVNWGFGNAIAERSDSFELDKIAMGMAPSDPLPHQRIAHRLNDTFIAEDADHSQLEFEIAAKLAPNDYLAWLALGSSRSRNGDVAGAESALRYAAKLAPNYTRVQWTLGNFLLRQGKTDEAFAEIRKAAKSDQTYYGPAAATAMQTFENDLSASRIALGNSPRADAELAVIAANQKRYDEALEVWNAIPAESKLELKEQGEKLINASLAAKKFRDVLGVYDSIGSPVKAEIGKIYNGGFEDEILPEGSRLFDWQIQNGTTPIIGLADSVRRSGKYSLALVFNSPNGAIDRTISQTVAVEPNSRYRFDAFYRSKINSGPSIFWEILNAEDNTPLTQSLPLEQADDWRPLSLDIIVPNNCDGITIRISVGKCASLDCQLSGPVWFDDLSLTSLQ